MEIMMSDLPRVEYLKEGTEEEPIAQEEQDAAMAETRRIQERMQKGLFKVGPLKSVSLDTLAQMKR